jgi:predicted RNase H-like HicB family nuclease
MKTARDFVAAWKLLPSVANTFVTAKTEAEVEALAEKLIEGVLAEEARRALEMLREIALVGTQRQAEDETPGRPSRHHCGEMGYRPGVDEPCPACPSRGEEGVGPA